MWCQRPVIVWCQWRMPSFSSGACARSEHPYPGDNVDSAAGTGVAVCAAEAKIYFFFHDVTYLEKR